MFATPPFGPGLIGGFNPVTIAGLNLWYDFSDNSTLTLSGSDITNITDKSPAGNNGSATASHRPTKVTNAQNGLSVANLSSSSQQYIAPTSSIAYPSAAWTIFLVYSNYYNSNLEIFGNITSSPYTSVLELTSGKWYLANGSNYSNTVSSGFTDSSYHQLCAIWNGSSYSLYIDNSVVSLSAPNVYNNSGILGRVFYGDGAYCNGRIGELLFSNQAVDATTRGNMYNYQKTKWGTP